MTKSNTKRARSIAELTHREKHALAQQARRVWRKLPDNRRVARLNFRGMAIRVTSTTFGRLILTRGHEQASTPYEWV